MDFISALRPSAIQWTGGFGIQRSILDFKSYFKLQHHGVHNFSLGTLDAYFSLSHLLVRRKAFLYGGSILVVPPLAGGGYKIFMFSENEDLSILTELQKCGVVYSISPLKLKKGSKFKEIAYDLKVVFDPASYKNKKQRHKKLRYPFSWMERADALVEPITLENFAEVEALHEKWVEYKLADPKTYQIMFPRKRYINCCKKVVNASSNLLNLQYFGVAIRIGGKIEVVRVVYVDGQYGFDLAFFGNTWSDDLSQLMNYADTYLLSLLYTTVGVKYFNCGAALNKNLQAFKTSLPYYTVESYAYSRIKD